MGDVIANSRRQISAINRVTCIHNLHPVGVRAGAGAEIAVHVRLPWCVSRGVTRYFGSVVLDVEIISAGGAVYRPHTARGVSELAIGVIETFVVYQIRSQTCGGQTGDSKGEEMFLHRQFWIGASMRLDRNFRAVGCQSAITTL